MSKRVSRSAKKKQSIWVTLTYLLIGAIAGFFVLCFLLLRTFWGWYRKQSRQTQVMVGAIIAVLLVVGGIGLAVRI